MKWLKALAIPSKLARGSVLKWGGLLLAIVLGFGFWLGMEFQKGRHALIELAETRAEQRQTARVQAHQDEVSAEYEQGRVEREARARITDAELEAFIASRPDLWNCDIGADGLRIIESWSAPAAGQSDDTVPASGAAAGRRPDTALDGEHQGAD